MHCIPTTTSNIVLTFQLTSSRYFSRLNFDVEAQEYKRQVESGRSGGFCQGNYEDDDDTDYKVLNLEPILGMVLRYHVGTIALSALVRFGQSAAVLLLWCLHAIFEALARVHITTRCLRTVADVPVKLRRFLMTCVTFYLRHILSKFALTYQLCAGM